MILSSRIKQRRGDVRHVHFEGAHYPFRKQEDGEFTCDVRNNKHAKALVDTGDFSPVGATLKRGAGAKEADTEHNGANGGAGSEKPPTPTETFDESVTAEAAKLLEGSAQDIGRDIGKASSTDVVRCALQLEGAEGGQQRKGVTKLLESTLEHIKTAGGQD